MINSPFFIGIFMFITSLPKANRLYTIITARIELFLKWAERASRLAATDSKMRNRSILS